MATYLDFEKSIKQFDEDISLAKLKGDSHAVEIFQKNLDKEIAKIYKNLSEYQRLQLARHPDRPYALDYIRGLLKNGYEIFGDRMFSDDKAMVCYLGYIGDQKVVIIGEQKGRGTKYKLKRNFGMPNPEGYRKALRVAKLAEKFEIPILFLIDTPGAYPGLGAEERGQSEAIARNLYEFSALKVPTVAVVIGEGGSGGALAIGVANKLALLKNSVFSVISPEGCASILYKDATKADVATKYLKITADELYELELIDDVISEPKMGAHRDKEGAILSVGNYFLKELEELKKLTPKQIVDARMEKLLKIGAFKENL